MSVSCLDFVPHHQTNEVPALCTLIERIVTWFPARLSRRLRRATMECYLATENRPWRPSCQLWWFVAGRRLSRFARRGAVRRGEARRGVAAWLGIADWECRSRCLQLLQPAEAIVGPTPYTLARWAVPATSSATVGPMLFIRRKNCRLLELQCSVQ